MASGLYEYLRLSFCIKNVPSIYQGFMNKILGHFPFLFMYINDILIFFENEIEQYNHLHAFFQVLHKYSLAVNVTKCELFIQKLNFLSCHISKDRFSPVYLIRSLRQNIFIFSLNYSLSVHYLI